MIIMHKTMVSSPALSPKYFSLFSMYCGHCEVKEPTFLIDTQ